MDANDSETEEITIEVDGWTARRVTRRLSLIQSATEISSNEALERYLKHGMAHHEEAIYR